MNDEAYFCHAEEHRNFLQVDITILGTQSNNLAIALQYLTNEASHKAFLEKIDKESFTRIIKYFSTKTAFVFYCDAKHSDI